MSFVQLQELKNCVDAKLRKSLGVDEVPWIKLPDDLFLKSDSGTSSKASPLHVPDPHSPRPAPPVMTSPHDQ
jgi:hypothetical protein